MAFVRDDISHLPPERIAVFERAALTEEQVEAFGLETAPPKASDGRSARWNGQTCQLEALTPGQLAGIVERSMMRFIDEDTYAADCEAEVTSPGVTSSGHSPEARRETSLLEDDAGWTRP